MGLGITEILVLLGCVGFVMIVAVAVIAIVVVKGRKS